MHGPTCTYPGLLCLCACQRSRITFTCERVSKGKRLGFPRFSSQRSFCCFFVFVLPLPLPLPLLVLFAGFALRDGHFRSPPLALTFTVRQSIGIRVCVCACVCPGVGIGVGVGAGIGVGPLSALLHSFAAGRWKFRSVLGQLDVVV